MDAIRKKMQNMKSEKEAAMDKAEQMEQKFRDSEEAKSKLEEDFNNLQKKFSNLQNEFDNANDQLIEATAKLEASEKQVAEGYVNEDLKTEGLEEDIAEGLRE